MSQNPEKKSVKRNQVVVVERRYLMNTTNIENSDVIKVKPSESESSRASCSQALEEIQRPIEMSEEQEEEYFRAQSIKKTRQKLGYAVTQLHLQFRAVNSRFHWQDFKMEISRELYVAKKALGVPPDTTSDDYMARLYDKLCEPESYAKMLVDFYVAKGLTFKDWYLLWEMSHVLILGGLNMFDGMSPDELGEKSKALLEKGVITSEEHSAIIKLVVYYNRQNFKSIDMGLNK